MDIGCSTSQASPSGISGAELSSGSNTNFSVAADALFGGDRTPAFGEKMHAKMQEMEEEDTSLRARVFSAADK
jgi:hypothetical protein